MTKKERVMQELGDIAKALNIKLDYIEEDYFSKKYNEESHREYILCDNQAICVNDTNIYGIRQEFMGYVFLREWRERSLGTFDKQCRNHIKQYWYDKDFNQPYLKR